MYTELVRDEVWRKRCEAAGYRVVFEPWERNKSPAPTLPAVAKPPAAR